MPQEKFAWVIIILFAIVALFILAPSIRELVMERAPPAPTPTTVTLQGYMKFSVVNPLVVNGTSPALGGATITVYDENLAYIGGVTTDSNGRAVLESVLSSGQSIWVRVAYDSAFTIVKFTAPYGTMEGGVVKYPPGYEAVGTTSYFSFKVELVPLPTLEISVLDPDYNKITEYNVTAKNNKKPEFTLIIKNTALDTGVRSVVGMKGETYGTYVMIEVKATSGTNMVSILAPYTLTRTISPTDVIYTWRIPTGDEPKLDYHYDAEGNLVTAQHSSTLSIDATALSSGNTVDLIIKVYAYLNLDYYKENNAVNPEAVLLKQTTITIKA